MIAEDTVIDEIMEAKRQGYKFIKVFLDRSRIGRNTGEISMSGAVILRGYQKGTGMGGLPEYDFKAIPGESLIFKFSREDMDYICWMYDDSEPGYFSAVGYNRDLLATHIDDGCFIVKDQDVMKDVKKRYKFMKEHPGEKSVKRVLTGKNITSISTEEEIDEHIRFLQAKKEALVGNKGQIADLSTPDLNPIGVTHSEELESKTLELEQKEATKKLREGSLNELAELEAELKNSEEIKLEDEKKREEEIKANQLMVKTKEKEKLEEEIKLVEEKKSIEKKEVARLKRNLNQKENRAKNKVKEINRTFNPTESLVVHK